MVLPLPFGPTSPTRIPDVTVKWMSFEQRAAADCVGHIVQRDQSFGLPVRRGKIDFGGGGARPGIQVRQFADHLLGRVDARFRFGGAGLGAAAQPFDFGVHAVFERFLPLSLRVQIFFFRFEEMCCSFRSRAENHSR